MLAAACGEDVETVDEQDVAVGGRDEAELARVETRGRRQVETRGLEPRNRPGGRVTHTRELCQILAMVISEQGLRASTADGGSLP